MAVVAFDATLEYVCDCVELIDETLGCISGFLVSCCHLERPLSLTPAAVHAAVYSIDLISFTSDTPTVSNVFMSVSSNVTITLALP